MHPRDDPRQHLSFRRNLLSWFEKNGRDLPWRRTRDPYAVLISEVMLQQTQVSSVVARYREWLKRFPTVRSLARTRQSKVLRVWEGLGYYARARNLHQAAKVIVQKFGGIVPNDPKQLQFLPGVGRYTANAVAVFAFDRAEPIVEANTARVLARLFNLSEPVDSTVGRKKLWEMAAEIVPARGAKTFQSAMMDLGALVCRARDPECHLCPVVDFCSSPHPRPSPPKQRWPRKRAFNEAHYFATRPGAVLLQKCRGRWTGMWMLPPFAGRTTRNPVYVAQFPFTGHKITLTVFRAQPTAFEPTQRWFAVPRLKDIPIPSPHRRAIRAILSMR